MHPTTWRPLPVLLLVGASLGVGSPASAGPRGPDRTLPVVRIVATGDLDPDLPFAAVVGQVLEDAGHPVSPGLPPVGNPSGKERGITINTSHVEYQTKDRVYEQDDEDGIDPLVRDVVTGASGLDGAILVVSVPDGTRSTWIETVRTLRALGAPAVVPFLDVGDGAIAPGDLDLVEEEVRDLLVRSGYPGDKIPVIKGSALGAHAGDPAAVQAVLDLVEALDAHVPLPPRDKDKPFLMPVEDVFRITGRGTVATGRIETGVVHVGDAVDVVGMGAPTTRSTITGIEMFRKILDTGEAGDRLGLRLGRADVLPGQVLAAPGTATAHAGFKALVYAKEEGGRHTPFHNKYRPSFRLRTTDVTGEITLEDGRSVIAPGSTGEVTVRLIVPVAMDKGLRFTIREGGRTVGAGQVTEIVK